MSGEQPAGGRHEPPADDHEADIDRATERLVWDEPAPGDAVDDFAASWEDGDCGDR